MTAEASTREYGVLEITWTVIPIILAYYSICSYRYWNV